MVTQNQQVRYSQNMAYNVQISGRAERDLDNIYQYYLEEFSETSALKVIKSLQDAISFLYLSPLGYTDFDSKINRKIYPQGNLRMIPSKHYLIFYLVQDERVDVLRIIHSKTDYLNNLENLFKNLNP